MDKWMPQHLRLTVDMREVSPGRFECDVTPEGGGWGVGGAGPSMSEALSRAVGMIARQELAEPSVLRIGYRPLPRDTAFA